MPPIPAAGAASDDELVAAVLANVKWQMAGDRKTTGLKQLQVIINIHIYYIFVYVTYMCMWWE